jgi:hypothetical protein
LLHPKLRRGAAEAFTFQPEYVPAKSLSAKLYSNKSTYGFLGVGDGVGCEGISS